MLKEELLFNFKTKLKALESVVSLPICLVLSITQNMEFLLSQWTILQNMLYYRLVKDLLMVEFFIIFYIVIW